MKAVLRIKEKEKITNKEYVELNKVSRRTATRELQDMVEKDILKTVGKGKRDLSYALLAQKWRKNSIVLPKYGRVSEQL